MSVQALGWALAQTTGSCQRQLVLIALANYADDEGAAWPSVKTLEGHTQMSGRMIQRHLKQLEIDGFLKKIPRTRPNGSSTSNTYQLSLSATSQSDTRLFRPGDTDVTPPVSLVTPPDPPPERAVRKTSSSSRAPDEIWDSLVEAYGPPSNSNERGRLNKAVKLLRESKATPDDIRSRSRRWSQLWPNITPTALGLANNWTTLGPTPPKLKVVKTNICPVCEVGGGMHTADCPIVHRQAFRG
jgi:hypothetical protein